MSCIYDKRAMETERIYTRHHIQGHNQMRMEYIGKLLRNLRYDTTLSLEHFSKKNKISRSLLERIETGQNITIHSLLRICDIFQISPEEIFEGVD